MPSISKFVKTTLKVPSLSRGSSFLSSKSSKENPSSSTPEPSIAKTPPLSSAADSDGEKDQEVENLWVRAEQTILKDEKKAKIWQTALEILEAELELPSESKLEPTGTAARQNQLWGLIERKTKQVESQKWSIQFGDHRVEVRDQLMQVAKNVLMVKDIVNTAATASPPAAIACAGATVILTFVIQAVDQHAILLQGLETTSGLICRLHVTEELYRDQPSSAPSRSVPKEFKHEFEKALTELYGQILEFQACALCYLRKPWVAQLFGNAFKQDSWKKLLQDLKSSEENTTKFTGLIDATKLKEIQDTQKRHLVWQQASVRDEKAKRLLLLLYVCQYRDRKDRNNERVPGTCEWFTHHPRFEHWYNKQGSNLLWVSADPGCGKSVLAKYLVDSYLPASRRTVCYFFFKDDFSDQKTAVNAICSILRQLFLAQPHLLDDTILDRVDKDGEHFTRSFTDLWITFIKACEKAGEVVCVLDALDECLPDERTELLSAVTKLYTNELNANLKFLMTSRPYEHIRRNFHELESRLPTIHLKGEGEEEVRTISHEIDLVVQKRVEIISQQQALEANEQNYLQYQLMKIPNRTYLWIELTLDVIKNMVGFTRGNVRRAIQQIPKSVDDAYSKMLDRIPSHQRHKAMSILHIVTAARRPLTVKEVALAIAITSMSQDERSCENITDELEPETRFRHTIRDLCGLFVVIMDSKVFLLHQTAKEFLVRPRTPLLTESAESIHGISWKHSLRPTESNKLLAEICILYIHCCGTDTTLKQLLEYSSNNWMFHFIDAGIQDTDPLVELTLALCDTKRQLHTTWTLSNTWYRSVLSRPSSPFTTACCLGLDAVVHRLAEDPTTDLNIQEGEGTSPLWWAAQKGYDRIVKYLINTGKLHINIRKTDGSTPLSAAASAAHEEVVKTLLAAPDIDPGSRDQIGRTPLSLAAENGHVKIIQHLIALPTVDINSKDNEGWTPLSWAAGNGHLETIKALLADPRVDADSTSESLWTPLAKAAAYGREAAVQALLDCGSDRVDPDSSDSYGRTSLSWAVRGGHTSVVRILLASEKVDINRRDGDGRAPLSYAAQICDLEIVDMLLDETSDLETPDHLGMTPLDWAEHDIPQKKGVSSRRDNVPVVVLLWSATRSRSGDD